MQQTITLKNPMNLPLTSQPVRQGVPWPRGVVSRTADGIAVGNGRLTYLKPHEDMPLMQYDGYGEWAAWEGMFWVWHITRDESLRRFLLGQFERRLTEQQMEAATTDFRAADYNAAAYAWYLSGDDKWLHRVARPFRLAFRAVHWPFAWVKSMYFIKLALDHGIISDDDVLIA